jgi:hypothetical protein
MRGREFTVYIFQYDPIYATETDAELLLRPSDAQTPRCGRYLAARSISSPDCRRFWVDFVRRVERSFADHGIHSRGCAAGDLPLGVYASLRNEAFVPYDPRLNVPPGWQGFDAGALALGKVRAGQRR